MLIYNRNNTLKVNFVVPFVRGFCFFFMNCLGFFFDYVYPPQPQASIYGGGGVSFAPGTNPEIIRSFHSVDKDRSGFIDERELQEALSYGYQRFSLRTVRLLMFLFNNSNDPLRIGPNEFAALWSCLGQWRVNLLLFTSFLELVPPQVVTIQLYYQGLKKHIYKTLYSESFNSFFTQELTFNKKTMAS
ncbi:hypothetical protein MKW94_028689 [Papaver nudicaule]|uniref:EF-hand domain-containing protein n=1 Tax=Papaver nudicaule TaxID=74823 RepID=A0AA41SN76_PAPNU|nr:hypothetical protein [Papaver nudicaule]